MATQIIVHEGHPRGGPGFRVHGFDLHAQGATASPVLALDDFQVVGRPFPPHPHAGFSAVTYVFEDSPGGVRSIDSIGNDIRVGPGGIVWTQAGSGVIHHELPAADDRPLHGAQIFVNLSARNKHLAPTTLWLDGPDVPTWESSHGDRVRVIVGRFESVASPLVPAEDFTLLDLGIEKHLDFELSPDQHAILYVASGNARVTPTPGHPEVEIPRGQAAAMVGATSIRVSVRDFTRALLLAGREIREQIVMNGPFIMNTSAEIAHATRRYEAGKMGRLQSKG